MIIYIVAFIALFVSEIIYFKIADRFNIIDKPNNRSSHTQITLRGGGIIFYIAAGFFFILSGFQYPFFFLGLTLMSLVSFADDILTLSSKIRLFVHFVSVLLMAYELKIFDMPWYYLAVIFIVVIGFINAYNFMDGINGMTASNSLAVGGLLAITNSRAFFIEKDFLFFVLIATLIFAFFNFRNKAKCFAGDVGAVAMSYILLFALAMLIIKTQNFIYIMFLSVYGVDTFWTIIQRLSKRENIFQAHRSHLYQYMANEMAINKLLVSFLYGSLQFGIGLFVICFEEKSLIIKLIFTGSLLFLLSTVYLASKKKIIHRVVNT